MGFKLHFRLSYAFLTWSFQMRHSLIHRLCCFMLITIVLATIGGPVSVSAEPSLISFESPDTSGIYKPGDTIEINAKYDELLLSGSYITVLFNNSVSLKLDVLTTKISPHHEGGISNGDDGTELNNPHSVYVKGNYAYIAVFESCALEIIDISDPSNPRHKGNLIDTENLIGADSVFVSGNYAYVTGSACKNFEIIDISDPENPARVGNISDGQGGAFLNMPYSVFVSGDYAYITSGFSNALEIVDIHDPSAPVHAAAISHGDGEASLLAPRSIYISGNYAYIASSGSDALEIVNISDPTAPVHTGSILNGGDVLLDYPTSVFVSGDYAYVTSRDSDSLEIIDINFPSNPVHTGSLSGTDLDAAYSVFVSGKYAYVACRDSNRLEIIDISTPSNPVYAGNISNTNLDGVRSVFVSGGMAYLVSTFSDTLEIISIGSSTLSGTYSVNAGEATPLLNIDSIAAQNAVSLDGMRSNTSTILPAHNLKDNVSIEITDPISASFSAAPILGVAPITVLFTDSSTGSPTVWNWSFGDGEWFNTTDSTLKNPSHNYLTPGTYTVSLTVINPKDSNTITRRDYITVNSPTTTATTTPIFIATQASSGSSSSSGGGGSNTNTGTGFATGIKAGDNVSFGMDKGAVYVVSFTADKNIQKLIITVKRTVSVPSTIGAPDTEVYEYEDVTLYYTENSDLSDKTFEFKVKKSWLTEIGYTYGDIVMLHHNEETGEWEELTTTFTGEDGTYCYYSAKTPSFSWFAIAVSGDATIVPESASAPVTKAATAVSTETSSSFDDTIFTGGDTGMPLDSEESEEQESGISLALPVLFVALVIIIIAGFAVRKKRQEYPDWWDKEFK